MEIIFGVLVLLISIMILVVTWSPIFKFLTQKNYAFTNGQKNANSSSTNIDSSVDVSEGARGEEYVKSRLKEMKRLNTFGTKKEIKHLSSILAYNEDLLYIVSGILNGNTWLIACTDRRIIMLDRGMIYGTKQRDVPLNMINSVSYTTKMITGTLTIWDGSGGFKIDNIENEALKIMVSTINKAIENAKRLDRTSMNTSNPDLHANIADELKILAELRSSNALTEEEFESLKCKLISKL